jgi:hypothetical protein
VLARSAWRASRWRAFAFFLSVFEALHLHEGMGAFEFGPSHGTVTTAMLAGTKAAAATTELAGTATTGGAVLDRVAPAALGMAAGSETVTSTCSPIGLSPTRPADI